MRVDRTTVTTLICAGAVAVGIAYVGTAQPLAFVAFGALVVAAAVAVIAYHYPVQTIAIAPLLVLLAGTKFRSRDAASSLSNQVDGQIVYEIGIFGLIGIAVLAVLLTGRIRLSRISWLEVLLLGFILFAAASTVWSGTPVLTAVRATQLAILWGLATVSIRVLGAERSAYTFGTGIAGGVLVLSTLALFIPAFRHGNSEGRFGWFSVHPIAGGTLAGLGLLFVLSLLLFSNDDQKRGPGRGLAWLLLIGLAAVLLGTMSRGPMLAVLAGSGILVSKRYLKFWQSQAVAALAALGAVAFINSELTFGRLLALGAGSDNPLMELLFRGQSAEQLRSITGRTDLWSALLPMIADRPLQGVGYHGSRGLLLEIESWAGYAHNALLQTALDLGVTGALLLWIPILVVVVIRVAHRPPSGYTVGGAYLTGAIVFLVLNSFTSESFAAAPGVEILLLFLCILAYGARVRTEKRVDSRVQAVPRARRAGTWPSRAAATSGAR